MASQVDHGTASKSMGAPRGRYLIKSSLLHQTPLYETSDCPSDIFDDDDDDDDPLEATIRSNRATHSQSNLTSSTTSFTDNSADSDISFRRERLNLYIQNTRPPPPPRYPTLGGRVKRPREPQTVDNNSYGGWNIADAKPDAAVVDANEVVLWGGAAAGDTSTQWAPTCGGGRKRKRGREQHHHQEHFSQPPATKTQVNILPEGMKWRTAPINGNVDEKSKENTISGRATFIPCDRPANYGRPIGTNMSDAAAGSSNVTGNTGKLMSYGNQNPLSQPQSRYPRRPFATSGERFVIEVESEEEENGGEESDRMEDIAEGDLDANELDVSWEWDQL